MSTPVSDPVPPCVSAPRDDSRWFAAEVQAHDGQLKAYLRGSFPSVRDVDDVVQESYLRIWRARARTPIESARAFLFRVAKHVAVDLLRRNRNSPITSVGDVGDLAAIPVLEDGPSVTEQVSTAEKLQLLGDALATLPPRSRELIVLCKIKGLTHSEAAVRLGISPKTADEHILRGLKRLDREMRQRGIDGYFGG